MGPGVVRGVLNSTPPLAEPRYWVTTVLDDSGRIGRSSFIGNDRRVSRPTVGPTRR